MNLLLIGVNYRTATLDDREALAFGPSEASRAAVNVQPNGVLRGRRRWGHYMSMISPQTRVPPVDTQSAWIHAVAIERWPGLSTKLADSIARATAPTLPRFPMTGLDPEGLFPETIGLDSAR